MRDPVKITRRTANAAVLLCYYESFPVCALSSPAHSLSPHRDSSPCQRPRHSRMSRRPTKTARQSGSAHKVGARPRSGPWVCPLATCPPRQIAWLRAPIARVVPLTHCLPDLIAVLLARRRPHPGRQAMKRCLSSLPGPCERPDSLYEGREPRHNLLAPAPPAPGCSAIRRCSMCSPVPATKRGPVRTSHGPHRSLPVVAPPTPCC